MTEHRSYVDTESENRLSFVTVRADGKTEALKKAVEMMKTPFDGAEVIHSEGDGIHVVRLHQDTSVPPLDESDLSGVDWET
jgi:hypothetical protein